MADAGARLRDVARHPPPRALQHPPQVGSGPTALADHECESLWFFFFLKNICKYSWAGKGQ